MVITLGMVAGCFVDDFQFGLGIACLSRIGFAVELRQFPLHFQVVGKTCGLNGRRCDCAAGFGRVGAVAEAARLRELLDIFEGVV